MRIIKVEGYHGTARKNTKNITSEGFVSKIRDDHWLGQGIYFYSDYDLALWWIKTKMGSVDGSHCAVFKATMQCQEHLWLDLDSPKGVDYFFQEVMEILLEDETLISLRFETGTTEERIKNFCFACDLLKQLRGIQLMARTFRKKRPSYARHNIDDFNRNFFPLPIDFMYLERQICSTTNDTIMSKTIVFPN